MTKRIFRSISIAAIAVFCTSLFLTVGILYDYFSETQRNELKTQTLLAAQTFTIEGEAFFETSSTHDFRITRIAADGAVLYDSAIDKTKAENHLTRKEIQSALHSGYGESSRFSSTANRRSLYSAKKLPDGTVLRLSVPQSSIIILLFDTLKPICIIFFAAIILSTILASRLAKKIVQPLNKLDLDNPLSNKDYSELSPLFRRLDLQQRELTRQESQLKRKETEFDAVTANMSEGLILLNDNGIILSINPAAKKILEADHRCVGKNILEINYSTELQNLLSEALGGSDCQTQLTLSAGKYQFNANPVTSENHVSGAVILMFNVTEKENAEQMRREFTANVSHELKTPLHSISGYAELMQNGLVKPQDINSFSEKIYSEAQRMIRLVDDIIKLSRLDEGANSEQCEPVNLYTISKEVLCSLQPAAELANVSLAVTGEDAEIYAFPQHIRGIIFNLCDNAIKYNRPGGSVEVKITSTENAACITVCDTGIGIPAEHHNRIFERFYSVDRSHSKEIGGTGLGLSIVKHAAKLHNAKIELSSIVDKGTTISVHFPK